AGADHRCDHRREPRAGRELPERQGGPARLLRRPGDEGDAGQGRPEGRQPASSGTTGSVGASFFSSSRLGAFRIDGETDENAASAARSAVKTATVVRGDVTPRSRPAVSGPSGAPHNAIVRATLFTRPVSRSGVTATR